MQRLLIRRVFRHLKQNGFRYLALFLLVAFAMYIDIAVVAGAETVIREVMDNQEEMKAEDGQFRVFIPLSEQEIQELENAGITIEAQFYLDYKLADGSVLRVFQRRKEINLISVTEGDLPKQPGEVFLEQHYAGANRYSLGSDIVIGGNTYQVTGTGSTPDYDAVKRNLSDAAVEHQSFGTAFVCEEEYERLVREEKSSKSEEYVYSYLLNNSMTDEELKDRLSALTADREAIRDKYFHEMLDRKEKQKTDMEEGIKNLVAGSDTLQKGINDLANGNPGLMPLAEGSEELYHGLLEFQEETDKILEENFAYDIKKLTAFLKRENNSRFSASVDDVRINRNAGLLAGIIIMVLFTYVISVFVIHEVEQESSIIGALYALGVKRGQLLFHYLLLPVSVTLLGGWAGTALGFSPMGAGLQMKETIEYFSMPVLTIRHPFYLILFGMVMPPLVAVLVNSIVIYKKLARPVLTMLRKEQKAGSIRNIGFGNMGFVSRFQLRQMLRELRSAVTVLIGMFISMLLLMLGINCYTLCKNYAKNVQRDTTFGYMYTCKYPEEQVPEEGEACYVENFQKESMGYFLDVSLVGVDQENPYFDVEVGKNQNEIVVSRAVSDKFHVCAGDTLVLSDTVNNREYAFNVKDVIPLDTLLFAFMDIDAMRELFCQEEDYYNVVFSEQELPIENGRLYSVTSRSDIINNSNVFLNTMQPLIIGMTGISIIVFMAVLYLMMKVMIDRSAFSISLMKIFGYRRQEIKKLYIDGNTSLIVIGAAVCLPLAKLCMDKLYPYLCSNVGIALDLTFSPWTFCLLYAGIILCYLVINQLLTRRLRHLLPAEVLKNRE